MEVPTPPDIEERLARIAERLDEVRGLDRDLITFGAAKHRYRLNPPTSQQQVTAFESQYGIHLPEGFRAFVTQLGNGGAGPWYGLEPLENGILDDLDLKSGAIDPGSPFPHETAWNLDLERHDGSDDEPPDDDCHDSVVEEYFDPKWVQGAIRIANFGCGVSLNLVVNGPEYGNIWVDDRGNDGGVYPDPFFGRTNRTDFLTWYEIWLERTESELEKGSKLQAPMAAPQKPQRPSLVARITRRFRRS